MFGYAASTRWLFRNHNVCDFGSFSHSVIFRCSGVAQQQLMCCGEREVMKGTESVGERVDRGVTWVEIRG